MTEAELTCKELTELITDYLEEKLPLSEKLRFETHLSGCPGCVAYVEQMRLTIRAIGAKPQIQMPAPVESALLEAFRRWKNTSDPTA